MKNHFLECIRTGNLPSRLPDTFDAAAKRQVTFGVELEGFIEPDILLTNPARGGKSSSPRFHGAYYTMMSDMIRKKAGVYCINETHPDNTVYHYDFPLCHVDHNILPNAGAWFIKPDATINPDNDDQIIMEIVSPILCGIEGLRCLAGVFDYLEAIEFKTNNTCALQVHVSLGWNPYHLTNSDLQDCVNIHTALKNNAGFFDQLYEPFRLNKYFSLRRDFIDATTLPFPPEGSYTGTDDFLKGLTNGPYNKSMYSFRLTSYGTMEYRGKEAKNYHKALGYIGFVTAFTAEAAKNPNLKIEDVMNKYFAYPSHEILVTPPSKQAHCKPVNAFHIG